MPESLRETLEDIRRKLHDDVYLNEEHVRLSLVARVLQALGWDIWNPEEVNTEYYAVPREDKTKVDIALFMAVQKPGVFIEIKAVDKLFDDLEGTEKQVRDYNRNNSAPFCILTDGNFWRLYYSFTPGEFADKCFWDFEIQSTSIDDIQMKLTSFLSKDKILSGEAETDAKAELKKTEEDRILESLVAKAKAIADESGSSAITELIRLARHDEIQVTEEKAKSIYQSWRERSPKPEIMRPERDKREGGEVVASLDDKWMRLDGKKSELFKYNQVLIEVAEWLIKKGKIRSPIAIGRGYLVSSTGKHPNGKEFFNKYKLSNGMFLEKNFSKPNCKQQAFALIRSCGFSESILEVGW
jgi:predicted type IV restriction endonuclease